MANTTVPGKKSGPFSLIITVMLVISLGVALVWLWLEMGRSYSLKAMIAGTIYVMTPHSPGILESIDVRDGQKVQQGQQLARIRSVKGHEELSRYGQNQEGLQESAREREERLRKIYEAKVLQHVQAQLQRRDMDMQGGKAAVGTEAYASAVQREQTAGMEKGLARDEYEASSLARAGRGGISGQRLTMADSLIPTGGQAWLHVITCQAQNNNVLLAPVSGRIAGIPAHRGQMLLSEDTVMVLLPERRGSAPLRVTAEFPLAAFSKIKAGDIALMRSTIPQLTLHGTVREVHAPVSGAQSVLVHLQFPSLPEGVLSPGQEVSCEIHGHSIFGFSEF